MPFCANALRIRDRVGFADADDLQENQRRVGPPRTLLQEQFNAVLSFGWPLSDSPNSREAFCTCGLQGREANGLRPGFRPSSEELDLGRSAHNETHLSREVT